MLAISSCFTVAIEGKHALIVVFEKERPCAGVDGGSDSFRLYGVVNLFTGDYHCHNGSSQIREFQRRALESVTAGGLKVEAAI